MCRRRGGKCRRREVPAPGRKVPAPGSSCAGEESAGAGNKFESNKANKNEIHKNQLTNWIHHIKFPFWDPCCPKSKSSLTKPKWMMLFTQVTKFEVKKAQHAHTYSRPFSLPQIWHPLIENEPPFGSTSHRDWPAPFKREISRWSFSMRLPSSMIFFPEAASRFWSFLYPSKHSNKG